MSAIYIKRTHSLGMEKARNISQTVAEEIAGKYQISWQWREQDLIFRHPGASGYLKLSDDSVVINIRLGLFYLPFADSIQRGIEQQLEACLNSR